MPHKKSNIYLFPKIGFFEIIMDVTCGVLLGQAPKICLFKRSFVAEPEQPVEPPVGYLGGKSGIFLGKFHRLRGSVDVRRAGSELRTEYLERKQ